MGHSHRASCLIAIVLTLLSCSSRDDVSPTRNGPDYVAQLTAEFARWQKAVAGGTEPALIVWECALCPKIREARYGLDRTPEWESGREQDEPPLAEVKIPAPFGIGLYEVTRGQFAAFARATGRKPSGSCLTDRRKRGVWLADAGASYLDVGFEQADDHPAACVSFEDARDRRLAHQTRVIPPADRGGMNICAPDAHLLYAWSDRGPEACLTPTSSSRGAGCEASWLRGVVTTAPVGSHLCIFRTT